MLKFNQTVDASGYPAPVLTISDTIHKFKLEAGVVKDVVPPFGAGVVVFNSTDDFYLSRTPNVDAEETDSITGGELNPHARLIETNVSHLYVVAPRDCILTCAYYQR